MSNGGDSDADGPVLSPEELDIEAREEVAAIGEDRYVIGADSAPEVPEQTDDDADDDATDDGKTEPQAPPSQSSPSPAEESGDDGDVEITGPDVKRWLADELAEHESSYAYRIAAKSGRNVNHQQLATDDIGAAFDGLLVWYAQQVAEGTPVDEALGILLSESTVQVRYPTGRLIAYVEQHDLGPEDSIRDLVRTVDDEEGLVFPRRR